MKLNFKNVLFSVGIFAFTLALVGVISTSTVEAAARTASVSGNWEDTATWGGSAVPTASDDVTVNTNINVTINSAAVANSVIINGAAGNSQGITIAGSNSLTVTGDVTLAAPTGDSSSSLLDVAAGTLSVGGDLIITGGSAASRIVETRVSTGTIDVTGSITFSGTAAAALLTSTGASEIFVGGNFTSGGTFDGTGSTLTFDGAGSVLFGVYATYNDVIIDKTDTVTDGVTLASGVTTILGDLTVTSGFFNTYEGTFTATGSTTVEADGTLRITSATGSKTFTGDVTIDEGGVWTEEAVAEPVAFAGSLANSGTFTADTGIHTFSGAAKTISGTVSIPNLTISGTISNTGTLTVSTALAGAGTLTNAASARLTYGGASVTPTLTATATGNTVTYNAAGAQTVKPTNYYNLVLSGSGTKVYAGARAVGYDMTIGTNVKANIDDTITVSGGLKLGTAWRSASSWGFTGSSAANINTTYFETGTGKVVNALSHSSSTTTTSSSSSSSSPSTTTTTTTVTTTITPTPTTNEIPGCGARTTGFSSSTGASCVGNTGAATTTPAGTVIPGCGNRTTGFSSSSGVSCVGNSVGASDNGASNGNAYAFGNTVVKMGTKGEACTAWQNFLNDKANAGLMADGWCGKLTINAAKAWQQAVGLIADGLLGPASRAKAMLQ